MRVTPLKNKKNDVSNEHFLCTSGYLLRSMCVLLVLRWMVWLRSRRLWKISLLQYSSTSTTSRVTYTTLCWSRDLWEAAAEVPAQAISTSSYFHSISALSLFSATEWAIYDLLKSVSLTSYEFTLIFIHSTLISTIVKRRANPWADLAICHDACQSFHSHCTCGINVRTEY